MTDATDAERYAKDPSQLIDLCREVVDRLDTGTDQSEMAAMEAQLREIARAMDRLDKQGVPVPDALRGEKTRLAAAVGAGTEAMQTLGLLADDLEEVLTDLKQRIGRPGEASHQKKPRVKRPRSPKTDKATLRDLLIEALRHFNGCAPKKAVLEYMEAKLRDRLLPGDLEWRAATNDHVWQNTTCWLRFALTQDGTMKAGSPKGTWELNGDHL